MVHELLVHYHPFFGNKFVTAGLIILISIILSKIILLVFEKYLLHFATRTKTDLDDLIFKKTKHPIFFLILVYGLKLAVQDLGWNGNISKLIASLLAVVFVYILGNTVVIIIDSWGARLAKKTDTKIDDVLLPLLNKAVAVISVIIALLWVMKIWSINITPYLAGVGLSGLVLGLALQDTLKNIFGGISLIIDKNFQMGDKIKLETGEVGEIYDVGLRSTKLVTYDHEVIYVPNGQLANSRIQNYTRPTQKIRVKVPFSVEYGSDVDKVKKIVLGAMKGPKVLSEPKPSLIMTKMGDYGLHFQANFWVKDWQHGYPAKLDMTEKIYKALTKAKIGIPFPTYVVYTSNRKHK